MRKMFSEKQIEKLSKEAVQTGLDNGSVIAPSPKLELFHEEIQLDLGTSDDISISNLELNADRLYFLLVRDLTNDETIYSGLCLPFETIGFNSVNDYSFGRWEKSGKYTNFYFSFVWADHTDIKVSIYEIK